jgi:hypothetical protein
VLLLDDISSATAGAAPPQEEHCELVTPRLARVPNSKEPLGRALPPARRRLLRPPRRPRSLRPTPRRSAQARRTARRPGASSRDVIRTDFPISSLRRAHPRWVKAADGQAKPRRSAGWHFAERASFRAGLCSLRGFARCGSRGSSHSLQWSCPRRGYYHLPRRPTRLWRLPWTIKSRYLRRSRRLHRQNVDSRSSERDAPLKRQPPRGRCALSAAVRRPRRGYRRKSATQPRTPARRRDDRSGPFQRRTLPRRSCRAQGS